MDVREKAGFVYDFGAIQAEANNSPSVRNKLDLNHDALVSRPEFIDRMTLADAATRESGYAAPLDRLYLAHRTAKRALDAIPRSADAIDELLDSPAISQTFNVMAGIGLVASLIGLATVAGPLGWVLLIGGLLAMLPRLVTWVVDLFVVTQKDARNRWTEANAALQTSMHTDFKTLVEVLPRNPAAHVSGAFIR